jgi:cytochrome c oxidase subunit II
MPKFTTESINKSKKTRLLPIITLLALGVTGCDASMAVLNPQGPAAARITSLWWFLLTAGSAVFLLVMGLLGVALFRRRRDSGSTNSMRYDSRIVLYAGIVGPAVVLLVVFGVTVATLNALATPDILPRNTIHVIGHQWWWEVRYPHQQVYTANEIHIPAGEPVRIVLSSDDVIHSFWVPELHGKLDLVPGQTNEFWIQADAPGIYFGACAEFCGVQHAKMQFIVVAQPLDEYVAWLDQQQQPAREPEDSLARRGQQVFLESACVNCHTVAGTHATGDLGPDLTHIASRRTLAAATVANNRGNLSGWIADPQHIKPGAFMPPSALTGPELQALLAYLATLE